MMDATVFSKPGDVYAVRAKALLLAKGVRVRERPLPAGERESYVVIGQWRGTYEELGSLDLQGELDALLSR